MQPSTAAGPVPHAPPAAASPLEQPLLPSAAPQRGGDAERPLHGGAAFGYAYSRACCCYCTTAATAAALLLLLTAVLLSPGPARPGNGPSAPMPPSTGSGYQCPPGVNPNSVDLTFFVLGDWGRRGNRNQRDARDMMLDIAGCLPPAFVISTGDNFYPSGLTSPTDPMIGESFGDVYRGLQVPWYSVLGNHDYGDSFKDWKHCPKPRSTKRCAELGCCISPLWQDPDVNPNLDERWHLHQGAWRQSFLGGRLDITFIDTTPFIDTYYKKSWADVTGGILSQNTTQRAEEIEELLASSKAQWRLVVGHHPVHSYGEHCNPKLASNAAAAARAAARQAGRRLGPGAVATAIGQAEVEEEDEEEGRGLEVGKKDHCACMQWLAPLLARYGVAALFSGHDHDLQHIKRYDDDVHYIVSGAGSDVRHGEFDDADTSDLAAHFLADDQGFVVATVRGQELTLYFYAAGSKAVSYAVTLVSRA